MINVKAAPTTSSLSAAQEFFSRENITDYNFAYIILCTHPFSRAVKSFLTFKIKNWLPAAIFGYGVYAIKHKYTVADARCGV